MQREKIIIIGSGPELVEKMKNHAESFDARIVIDEVTEVELKAGTPFTVKTYQEEYRCDSLIIATGASPRRLGIPGEDRYIEKGVSFCATCDGFFFRDKEVLVIGGGDSAAEEAIFLTKFAKRVTIVHRRDKLRAGETLKKAVFDNEKIDIRWNTELFKDQLELDPEGYLRTDEKMMTSIPGVFAAGEVQDKLYRQIATSVGQGCAAGMMAIRRLQEHF